MVFSPASLHMYFSLDRSPGAQILRVVEILPREGYNPTIKNLPPQNWKISSKIIMVYPHSEYLEHTHTHTHTHIHTVD